ISTKMGALIEILRLISSFRLRRPARVSPFLDELFQRLARCARAEAEATEERIWDVWMHHPHHGAARELDLATGDIAARRYDIAETRLTRLLRRTLELEPRHFGAILHFAEILLSMEAEGEARFALRAARAIHPHLTIPD